MLTSEQIEELRAQHLAGTLSIDQMREVVRHLRSEARKQKPLASPEVVAKATKALAKTAAQADKLTKAQAEAENFDI